MTADEQQRRSFSATMQMHSGCNSRRVVNVTVTVDTRQVGFSADLYKGINTKFYRQEMNTSSEQKSK
jgi:hypothetical protein